MTVEKLYKIAKEKGVLNYEIAVGYSDLGHQMGGGCIAEITDIDNEHNVICLRGLGEEFFDLA